MKTLTVLLLSIIVSLTIAGRAVAGDEIYFATLSDTHATLSDGHGFTMRKGDCYPLVGYDSTQELVQLKLGSMTFWTRKSNLTLVSESDTPAAAQKYAADAAQFTAALNAENENDQQQKLQVPDEYSEGNRLPAAGVRRPGETEQEFKLRMHGGTPEEIAAAHAAGDAERAKKAQEQAAQAQLLELERIRQQLQILQQSQHY